MLRRFGLVVSALVVVGCVDSKGDSGGGNACDAPADNGGWSASVAPACVDTPIQVQLSDGSPIALDWATESDVACFPGTENLNFDGSHVFFWFAQPESSLLTVTATPDAGVDSSVYVIQSAGGRYEVPPDVVAAVACEAGYDAQNDSNPGEADAATVTATTTGYDILIGVAGAGGTTAGAVTLTLSLEQ